MLEPPDLIPISLHEWNMANTRNPYCRLMSGMERQTTTHCRFLLRRASQTNKIYGMHGAVVPEPVE